jgi:hypothetical protein
MPTISYFYGIFIRMYVRDHPPPHFHAVYGEYEANIAIATGEAIEGDCLAMLRSWSTSGPRDIEPSCW